MNKTYLNTHNNYGCFFMKFKEIKSIIKVRNYMVLLLQMIVGTVLLAISTNLFLLPNQLSSGGFSGIATITYYLFNIPVRNNGINIKYSTFYNFINKKWKKVFY